MPRRENRRMRVRRTEETGPGENGPLVQAADALSDALARFSDALSLLTVIHGSLSAKELPGTGDEEVALRYARDMFRAAYNARDQASACSP